MKSTKTSDGYIVVCSLNEEVISTLTRFAADNNIHSGTIVGIGALKELTLGYYDMGDRIYIKKEFHDEYELLGLNGNFAWKDNETILHCHAVFSNKEFGVIGGHVFSAKVGITGEFYIRTTGIEVHRGFDEATKLNLIRLS